MDIFVEKIEQDVPVTMIKLVGDLDASSYRDVIAAGRQAFHDATRNILLDLSEVGFMSSSGLVALHSLALIMRGEQSPDTEHGWSAMHAVADYVEDTQGFERHFKLLNPTARVMQTLEKTGFDHTFEVFSDQNTALASFG
jgi:anti-anti-sigma regulatory factor